MRRTYKSKKDTTGGLDHRDMLPKMDEKSSAFDAFYIQNIKQTKRELSSFGLSNHHSAASNKVRKRKYVKRIVKEVEPTPRESLSGSAYLTPDKSLRVKKALDPFDQLLNSSPIERIQPNKTEKNELFDILCSNHVGRTYNRKKPLKINRFNLSSSQSPNSDKENTTDKSDSSKNVSDIRTHKLLIEKEPEASPIFDESINKIVEKISILNNNLNHVQDIGSIKKPSYHHKNRLTMTIQSPLPKTSPLCSTPFNDKNRSKSIYKFSPIPMGELEDSPTYVTVTEEDNESNKSVVFIPRGSGKVLHKVTESNSMKSPITYLTINKSIRKINSKSLFNTTNTDTQTSENDKSKEVSIDIADTNKLNKSPTSSCQTSELEPFLGFSNSIRTEVKLTDADNTVLFEDEEKESSIILSTASVTKNSKDSLGFNKDSIENKTQITKNRDKSKDSSISNFSTSKYIIPSQRFIGFDNIKTENNLSSGSKAQNLSMNTNSHTSKYENNVSLDSQDVDRDSLYDTCNSDLSSEEEEIAKKPVVAIKGMNNLLSQKYLEKADYELTLEEKDVTKEPVVAIERMDGLLFRKYYEKLADYGSENKKLNESCDKSDNEVTSDNYDSFDDSSPDDTSDKSFDVDEEIAQFKLFNHDSTGFSNNCEDFISDEFDSDCSNDNKETSMRFVTTRRGKRKTSNSTILVLDDSSASSNGYNKTVISNNKLNAHNDSDSNFSVVNIEAVVPENVTIIEENAIKMNIECDSKDVDTRVSFITTRKSSKIFKDIDMPKREANIQSDVPENIPLINENKLNEENAIKLNTECDSQDVDTRVSLITTRKSSKIFKDIDMPKSLANIEEVPQNITLLDENEFNEDNAIKMNIKSDSKGVDTRVSFITTRKTSKIFQDIVKSKTLFEKTRKIETTESEIKSGIVLQPGKKWERSLSIYRRMTTMADHFDHSILDDEDLHAKGRKYRQSVISTMEMQEYNGSQHNETINSRRSTFVSKPSRSTIRIVKEPNISRVSLSSTTVLDDLKGFLEDCDDTIVELSKLSISDHREVTILEQFHDSSRITTAKDYVLRRCNQTDAILFDECYPDPLLKNCRKIGEGVYGEVFLWRAPDGHARVMKIVPIAGSVKVNGEHQKDFHEIISEIVIAMELSALRAPIAQIECHFDEGKDVEALDLHSVENATDIFNEVLAVRCVYGSYTSRLLDLWELYDECKGSENDNPAILPVDQQYIVLELANAGEDLESYQFNSAEQAHALFLQIAFGLAVGEEAFQFEHRDLHWGNVLIAPTDQKFATFVLRGRAHRVPRCGVAATIIDYSLSRLSLPLAARDQAALYNDLAADESLFGALGDYQFEVYRLMRDKLGNDWQSFEPYTNVLWLHYTVDKMITALRYKRTNTKTHKQYIAKLKGIKDRILNYGSAALFVLTDNEL